MDKPPADPAKLLDAWMEWEKGEATPGRVMSNLKTAGMREFLEQLASATPVAAAIDVPDAAAAEAWTPVV